MRALLLPGPVGGLLLFGMGLDSQNVNAYDHFSIRRVRSRRVFHACFLGRVPCLSRLILCLINPN